MTAINPPGTMFLGLIEELMDLVKNPAVSRIEVLMANYELDERGEKKMVDGKHSIAKCAFAIRGMNKEVQDKLRQQFEAALISHLMILWMEQFQNERKMGIASFNPVTKKKAVRPSDYDAVEKSMISDYLQGQTKK